MLETTDSSLQISYSKNFGVLLSQPFPQIVSEADIIAYKWLWDI